ncbi:hypothetical protein FXO38_11441 [Capsicum annuum]|nr:hypothetical protein FXO38_11441 [Capsicum annuum]
MALKGDSSSKQISKNITKNKPVLNSDYHLRNEETNKSSNDLIEYLMKEKTDPRERRPQGKKFEDDSDNDNEDIKSSSEDDGNNEEVDFRSREEIDKSNSEKHVTMIDIQPPPPQPQILLFIEATPMPLMTTTPGRFSPALVRDFYTAYRGALKRQYPQGKLWKGEICLEAGVPELLVIKQYIEPRNTINLGLIRDVVNPMTTEPKQEVALLAKALRNMDASTVEARFTEDTPIAWGDLRPSLLI